jgi:hypothetical protein
MCGSFWLSYATPWHIPMAQVITQQKLHDSCNEPCDQFNMQFRLRHGSPTRGNKTAGDAHHFFFFHVRPANQPILTGVDLCHRKAGRTWFTETSVIRYQPFVLIHKAWIHFECYTNDKGSNKTYENNIIPPTNIQYLTIHVRNWIRSRTSQWYTNRMKWKWVDKLQPTANVKYNTTSQAG